MTPTELAARWDAEADRHDARYADMPQMPLAVLALRARTSQIRAAAAWMRQAS